jgi:hypothetical protein
MSYKVTYVDFDLLTCTFSAAFQETLTCDITEKLVAEYDSELCTIGTAWEELDANCCDGEGVPTTYTGTGDDPTIPNLVPLFIAEYTTYDFATCEVTDTSCEYVDYCTVVLPPCTAKWPDDTQWPTVLYLLTLEYTTYPSGDPPHQQPLSSLQPVPMTYDEDADLWEGTYSFDYSPPFSGNLCYYSSFSNSGGCPLTTALRDFNDPSIGCPIPDTESYGAQQISSRIGNVLRLFPEPISVEYINLINAGSDICYRVFQKVMDGPGLSSPPPGLHGCTPLVYPSTLPSSLTVTITSPPAFVGVYSLSFANGMYRGTNCALYLTSSDSTLEGACGMGGFTVLARFYKWDPTSGAGSDLRFADSTLISCSPILINDGFNTITE